MKRIITIGMAILTLAACTKDNLKENVKGNIIDFRAVLTKVAETNTQNFDEFVATALYEDGTRHFENEVFERLGQYYYSGTDYYWPTNGSTLYFYAWAPGMQKLGGTLTLSPEAKTLTGFTTNSNISDQVDFISAVGSGNSSTASMGVEMNFKHNLSQIEIKSRTANSGYIYEIKGVRIANVLSSGDFDFETGTWSNVGTKTSYSVEYSTRTLDELSTSLMKTNGDNAMLIPQDITPWDPVNDPTNTANGAYIAVLARISTTLGAKIYPLVGDYDWIAVPLGGGSTNSWESGLRYIYTLDWSTGGGYVYPEKPAYGNDYQGIDVFTAGKKIMSSAISLGVKVNSWDNHYEDTTM